MTRFKKHWIFHEVGVMRLKAEPGMCPFLMNKSFKLFYSEMMMTNSVIVCSQILQSRESGKLPVKRLVPVLNCMLLTLLVILKHTGVRKQQRNWQKIFPWTVIGSMGISPLSKVKEMKLFPAREQHLIINKIAVHSQI